MKKILLIALLLSVGFSKVEGKQDLIPVVTYKDGDVSKISYHKITGNKIELVKEIDWYENGQKWFEETWKNGEVISSKCWDWNGNEMDYPSEDVIQYYEDEEPHEY